MNDYKTFHRPRFSQTDAIAFELEWLKSVISDLTILLFAVPDRLIY